MYHLQCIWFIRYASTSAYFLNTGQIPKSQEESSDGQQRNKTNGQTDWFDTSSENSYPPNSYPSQAAAREPDNDWFDSANSADISPSANVMPEYFIDIKTTNKG